MMLRCVALAVLTLTLQASAQTCDSGTCMNAGVCVIVQGAPSCACPSGFTGDRCETVSSDACINSPCLNGGSCKPLTATTFVCKCPAGTGGLLCLPDAAASTPAPTTIPTATCGTAMFDGCEKADVIFMISYSRYDNRDDVDHEGDYVKAIIGEFQVDPDHVRVGVVFYHDDVMEFIHLDDFVGDLYGLMNRIEVLTGARSQSHLNPSGQPIFSKALAYVKDVSFQRARPDAKKVIISIVHRLDAGTDEGVNILKAADELKADCVEVFVEAVDRDRFENSPYGGQPTSLLQQVASSPAAPHYYKWAAFTDLENAGQAFNINCGN